MTDASDVQIVHDDIVSDSLGVGGGLIGRDAALAAIDDRLRSRRLVTLIGPGGVGKTAAAQAAASTAAERFPLGVRFVDLARVDEPDAVAGTLAGQLGFESPEALLHSPGDQGVLVIVDNCEHVLDAAASIITALLDACRAPTVLATSRSPLMVPGESVVALAPLSNARDDGLAVADLPSVRLFLERARDAGVAIDADEVDLVADVCRQVDGLPLAIEIAAARTRSMGLAELLGRLDDGVEVLDRPRFRGSSRHRSMTAVVHWSIDLLDPAEADLLEWLSLFPGSFTRADARRLLPDSATRDVDDGIDSLVDASLVSTDAAADGIEYRLLHSVRACARRRLAERGELEGRLDRLADQVVESVWARLATSGLVWDPDLLRDVASRFDEITQSLRWCLSHDTEPRRAMSLCAALFAVVQQGRAHDIVTVARQAFERWPDAVSDDVPRAMAALGTLATAENLTEHPQEAMTLATGALAHHRSGWASVIVRRALGQSQLAQGDPGAAAASFAEGASEARRLGHAAVALELELAIAQLAADGGDAVGAIDAMVAARDEATSIGSVLSEIWASTLLAWTTLRSDAPAAVASATTTLERAREIGYPTACCGNLRTLVYGHARAGDLDEASAALDELYRDVRDRGALGHARLLVDAASVLAHRIGDASWASLAATVATAAPATVLSHPGFDLEDLPPTDQPPLLIRDAFRAVRRVIEAARDHSADTSVDEATRPDPTIRWRGGAWDITFAGRSVTVRASKGLADLVTLLAADGREVHCLDLVGAVTREESTGEVIDARARRAYEQRIRDLQSDIDDAEADNDHARAERAHAEFDALVEHLAAAVGHGGRTRRAGGSAERARSAVTQRLRAAVRNLESVHPDLGRHLQVSVRTGRYCSYAPEHPTRWTVEHADQ